MGPVRIFYSLLDVPHSFTRYLGFDPNGNSNAKKLSLRWETVRMQPAEFSVLADVSALLG